MTTGLDPLTRVTGRGREIDVADFGAIGDGVADDTVALQAAFDSLQHGVTLRLQLRAIYLHTGLTIDRKFQVTIIGNDSQDGYIDNGTGPRFVYIGTDGGDAITISNCYACTFRGFASLGALTNTTPGTTGATRNIHLTMAASGYPPISSQNIFQTLFIPSIGTRADYVGVDIDNPSGTNNEFHQFINCKLYGGMQAFPNQTGIGIRLGHTNAKHIILQGTTFGSFAEAIKSAAGSFRSYYCTFDANYAIVGAGSVSDGALILGADGEGNTQIVAGLQGTGTVVFELLYSRFDNLRGGQVASGSASDSPVLDTGTGLSLIVDGCNFGGLGIFTSDFIFDTSTQASVFWGRNFVFNENDSAKPIFLTALLTGLSTFRKIWGTPQGSDGLVVGGDSMLQNSFQGMMSTAMLRALIGVQLDDDAVGPGLRVSAKDSISIDQGQIEIAGLARPMRPDVSYVGANDSGLSLIISVLARDALGNRTIPSVLNQGVQGNTTLSGSNYIHVTWPKVPGVTDYLLLQFSGGTWRTIATVTPSGTNVEAYDIIANPAGAFSYVIPTFNEAGSNKFRGRVVLPNELVFTANDTTPSVAKANDFVTANSSGTSITTFDDGVVGQLIRIRINDANTTLVNGSGLLNRSGANIAAVNGLIYTYVRQGSSWYQLGAGATNPVVGVGSGYKIARGVASITGTGDVVTGLATVVSVQVTAQDDLDGDSLSGVSATIGNQSGAPAAGSITIKTWKVTTGGAAGNPTMIAASAAKNVNWFAIGTG